MTRTWKRPSSVQIAGGHAHAGLGHAGAAQRRPRFQGDVLKAAVAPVLEQVVSRGVVGHVQVLIPVPVQIQPEDSQTLAVAGLLPQAGAPGHVDEGASSQVPVEDVAHSVKTMGVAVDGDLPEIARFMVLKGELQVVGQVEVEQTVPVVIGEGGAGPPSGIRDPRSPAHVLEGAVPLVPVEHVGAHVGDVDVHAAIVVVVAERAPHAVGRVPGSRLPGDVGEGPVPAVPVEAVRTTAVDEIDVHPAVVVVVQKTASGPHGLDQVLGRRIGFGDLVSMDEFQPRLPADVGEPGRGPVSRRKLGVEDQKEDRQQSLRRRQRHLGPEAGSFRPERVEGAFSEVNPQNHGLSAQAGHGIGSIPPDREPGPVAAEREAVTAGEPGDGPSAGIQDLDPDPALRRRPD